MSVSLELIIDPPLAGALNMGIDDVLLERAVSSGGSLRFYAWREPTLSLGYFQAYDDAARMAGPLAELPVVRRVTGGGAIVHAGELTYSVALPPGHALAGSGPSELYDWMHRRIVEGVESLGGAARFKGGGDSPGARGGPFLCFERHACFDLVDAETGTLKLAGSAQRRTRRGVLQHGSVILSRTHPIQPSAALDEMPGCRAGGVSFDRLAEALIATIRAADVELSEPQPSRMDDPAMREAAVRHAADQWLRLR